MDEDKQNKLERKIISVLFSRGVIASKSYLSFSDRNIVQDLLFIHKLDEVECVRSVKKNESN